MQITHVALQTRCGTLNLQPRPCLQAARQGRCVGQQMAARSKLFHYAAGTRLLHTPRASAPPHKSWTLALRRSACRRHRRLKSPAVPLCSRRARDVLLALLAPRLRSCLVRHASRSALTHEGRTDVREGLADLARKTRVQSWRPCCVAHAPCFHCTSGHADVSIARCNVGWAMR